MLVVVVVVHFLVPSVAAGDVKAIAADYVHSMVLKKNNSVWATGDNRYDQLGDGSTTKRHTFVKVVPSGVTAVAVGDFHSMVLQQDGSVWGTGWNYYGQLGAGFTFDNIYYDGQQ